MSSAAVPGPNRQFKLAKESELRIEVGMETSLRLRLLSGTAEIFGTELPPDIWVSFPPSLKIAVCNPSLSQFSLNCQSFLKLLLIYFS